MNITFSVAGVVVFYYTARLFTSKGNAFLAALAYSTIYYVWFSGEIHSSYASQILFPVATYYVLLRYESQRVQWMLWLASLLFAVGAGLRPTDGVFLIPMLLYFTFFRMRRRDGVQLLALSFLLCLGWYIPTWSAYRHNPGIEDFGSYVPRITHMQSVLTGVRIYTVANFVRYALMLLAGLWPVLGIGLRNGFRNRHDPRVTALWIWIIPGSFSFADPDLRRALSGFSFRRNSSARASGAENDGGNRGVELHFVSCPGAGSIALAAGEHREQLCAAVYAWRHRAAV